MTPDQLQAKIQSMSDSPPSIKPFADAAQRAAVKAQSDLVRLNQASNVSIAVSSNANNVTVRWTVLPSNSLGRSQISPSAAIKAHLSHEMTQAKQQYRDNLGGMLS